MNEFYLICYHTKREIGQNMGCPSACCHAIDADQPEPRTNCWKCWGIVPGEICISSARKEVRVWRI